MKSCLVLELFGMDLNPVLHCSAFTPFEKLKYVVTMKTPQKMTIYNMYMLNNGNPNK